MRIALSKVAMAGALLSLGACFDPTRPCSTSADCANGGTCDPGTKTCVAAGNPNDRTPPVFSIALAEAPARQSGAKLTELDPGAPDGGVGAFRRDESVLVTVTSSDADVAADSVGLRVIGIADGGAAAPIAPTLSACSPGNPGSSKAFCREATVSLGPPLSFDAFRGPVMFVAGGRDRSGNDSVPVEAGVTVTRWKWRYSAGAPIYTTPAIADDGTIVFGTSDGANGALFALTPEGAEKWPPVALGPIEASPTIGAGSGASTFVYAATAPSNGSKLHALRLTDGTDAGVCAGSSGLGFSHPFLSGLALLQTAGDLGALESAVGLAGGTRLVTFRPAAQSTPDPSCLEAAVAFQQSRFETIATDGAALFLGAEDSSVRSFIFETTSINWVKNTAWGLPGAVLLGDSEITAAAIDGPELFVSVHPVGLARLSVASGQLTLVGPDGGISGEPSGSSVGRDTVVFAAGTSMLPQIFRFDRQSGVVSSAQTTGIVRSVPSRGADGVSYVLTTDGTVEAWDSALRPLWIAHLSETGGYEASPSLGCVPGPVSVGKGAVLYAATDTGELTAVVVDSRGLDPTAPWPKYQHDVRNTGNPTTPIQPCP